MATQFKIEHVWPVPRDIVLQHILDEELADRCNEVIRSVTRERISVDRSDDGRVVQRFDVKANSVPAAARRVLKPEMLEWIEESRWDPAAEKFTWMIETKIMKDKIKCSGELYYDDLGGKTRRVVLGTIEIKIPLAGRIAEKVIVGSLRQSYEEASRVESTYFQEKAGS